MGQQGSAANLDHLRPVSSPTPDQAVLSWADGAACHAMHFMSQTLVRMGCIDGIQAAAVDYSQVHGQLVVAF